MTGRDVGADMVWLAHPDDGSGDNRIRKNKTQSKLRKGHARVKKLLELFNTLDSSLQVCGIEIIRAPIASRKCGLLSQLSAEAAFVERHAGNDTDIKLFAHRKQFIFRSLVKDVVDDLNGVDQSRLDGGDAIGRFPAIQAYAECSEASAGFKRFNGFTKF